MDADAAAVTAWVPRWGRHEATDSNATTPRKGGTVRLVPYEDVVTAYAAAFDPASHSVLSSPAWLGALPRGSVTIAVCERLPHSGFLPVAIGRRKGVPMVSNPPLMPWVEIVGGSVGEKRSAVIGDLNAVGGEIARRLARCGVVRLRLQRTSPTWLGFHWAGYFANARISYVLEGPVDDAWSAMKGKTRTAIRSSTRAGLTIRAVATSELDAMAALVGDHAREKGFAYALGPEALRSFFAETLRAGVATATGAFDADGTLVGAAFFADDDRTRTYLIGAQDERGAKANAMPGLLWDAVEGTLDGGRAFDFEGSMLPGVEDFVRTFGGAQRLDVSVIWVPRPQRAIAAVRRHLAR